MRQGNAKGKTGSEKENDSQYYRCTQELPMECPCPWAARDNSAMTTPTHVQRSAVPLSTHDTTRIDDLRIKAVRPLTLAFA
jgi:hypothetical protein